MGYKGTLLRLLHHHCLFEHLCCILGTLLIFIKTLRTLLLQYIYVGSSHVILPLPPPSLQDVRQVGQNED